MSARVSLCLLLVMQCACARSFELLSTDVRDEDAGAPDNHDASTSDAGAQLGPFAQGGYLKASNTNDTDAFGSHVALSADGNTLVVSSPYEASRASGINGDQEDNSEHSAGAVYVFVRAGDVWSQQAYIKASNAEAGDQFGISIALTDDGNTLAVGAYSEDSCATGANGNQADNSCSDSGAVYVFARVGATWTQEAYLKASNPGVDDQFGGGVAFSTHGDTLAVGAPAEDGGATGVDGNQNDNSIIGAGAVYVFQRSGNTWTQYAYIKASHPSDGDSFGYHVALSPHGDALAISAHGQSSSANGINGDETDESAAQAGAVYVFTRAGSWRQEAFIKASNTINGRRFGWHTALSSDGATLAVGGAEEDSCATGTDGDQTNDSCPRAGAVYVFTRNDGEWMQEAYVKASNTDAEDNFGWALALAGDGTLAIGARGESSAATGVNGNQSDDSQLGSGAVYILARVNGVWTQQLYLKASNPDRFDNFGYAIAFALHGDTIAVGAPGESSQATGVGGDQSDNSMLSAGAVYVFSRE